MPDDSVTGIPIWSLQDFYTRTEAYMREADPAWPDEIVERAVARERVALPAVLGAANQRRALDCSCGGGTQAIPLAELGWHVTAIDATPSSLREAAARAARHGVAVEWREGDMRTIGSLFPGQFDWVLSCMALDNILDDAGLAEAVGGMRQALKPDGRCYLRLRNFDQLLAARPRYDVREERLITHGRVIRLEDWLYENEQSVVNVWIFLREDRRRVGYAWQTTLFAYRRRLLTAAILSTLLHDAGFADVVFLGQPSSWEPVEVVARAP